jgi:tetratricopeptide (TPR) repeat protein
MKCFSNAIIYLGSLALLFIGCQEQRGSSSELITVEQLMGDIVLCGGDTFGEVTFALSCDVDTHETFELAISLLHSFEYDEAKKAFANVIDTDADCAMAYWGLAMTYLGHPKFRPAKENFDAGLEIIEFTKTLSKTSKEGEYLDALGAYFEDEWDTEKSDHLARSRKMAQKMSDIYNKYPDDKEAAIFYALTLFGTADQKDKTYEYQRLGGAILESIFPDQPDHPGIAHYIIHNYDHPELAKLALSTARKYADIAPASSHAQHMPSHIFTRLGLWDESIQSNLNSASAAVCYASDTEMDGNWHNEIHAMDYLVYAYLQKGDNDKAMEQYDHLKTMTKEYPSTSSPYNFGAIPVRMVLENKQWEKAAELKYHSTEHHWDQFPWERALLHFARSLGASHIGDISLAEKELDTLRFLHHQLVDSEDHYRADQVLIQVKASQAWIAYAKGNYDKALTLMNQAVELEEKTGKHPVTPGEVIPASEFLGDMLLEMNKPKQALEAYITDLEGHPKRFNGIYGAAIAAKGVGDLEKATVYFEQLLKLCEGVNSNRSELEEAKEYLSEI